jgi:hypothetical protein
MTSSDRILPVAERQEKSQMLGEFLREMALLIIVLYPIDAYLQGKFDWFTFGLLAVFASALLYFGMILEGRNEI